MKSCQVFGSSQHGATLTEFAIAFPLTLVTVLSIMQMSLAFNARHVVEYAAFVAARTAAVQIPQDLSRQGGEDRNVIRVTEGYPKFDAIQRAAAMACVPISPRDDTVFVGSSPDLALGIALAGAPLPAGGQSYAARFPYANMATDVALSVADRLTGEERPLSPGETLELEGDEDVVAVVTHKLYLTFPLNVFTILGTSWGNVGTPFEGSSSDRAIRVGARYLTIRARAVVPLEGWIVRKPGQAG